MKHHNHNLNIHYSLPADVWDKIVALYPEMPHWNGTNWYGVNDKLIEALVEPSGLHFYAELPQDEWDSWFNLFKSKANELLGYEIGEPEDGFEFRYTV